MNIKTKKLIDSYSSSENTKKHDEYYTILEDMTNRILKRRKIKQQEKNEMEI